MKTITFYSYKGGVGRTLALSNIATRLAEFGKKVCLIDFDLEAPGLPHKFKTFKFEEGKGGLVDYINAFLLNNALPDIQNYIHKFNINKTNEPVYLMPAGDNYLSEYWNNVARIDWKKLFYSQGSHGVSFFLDLKEKIKKTIEPDFLLVDSRTGITEISGISISLFADEVVLIAANNEENIEGIKQVIHAILNPENQLIKKAPKIDLVLSRIPYPSAPEDKSVEEKIMEKCLDKINAYLKKKKIAYRFEDVLVIHSDRTLEIEESFKIGNRYQEKSSENEVVKAPFIPIAQDYLNLFEKLTNDVLTKDEVIRFNNLKESEYLIELSKNSTDSQKSIELLKKAIEYNPMSQEAFQLLATHYYVLERFDDTMRYANKALEINPENDFAHVIKGWTFLLADKLDEAENEFNRALNYSTSRLSALSGLHNVYLKSDLDKSMHYLKQLVEEYPEDWRSYNSIANVFRLKGQYEDALHYIYEALAINPTAAVAYCTLAEINAHLGNLEEFYKNLELALLFGGFDFARVYKTDPLYNQFANDPKFKKIIRKYNILLIDNPDESLSMT